MTPFDHRLTDYDISVMRMLNGESLPDGEVIPGAALMVTCEDLKEWGYVSGHYWLSIKGKDYLKEHRHRYKLAQLMI